MKRREFLSQLKAALENKLSAAEIKEQIDYYEGYINDEIAKGYSEEEVVSSLGDPWAIAKTIQISSSMNDRMEGEETVAQSEGVSRVRGNGVHKGIMIAVLVLVILVILSVSLGLISLVARFAFPIAVIFLVIRLFRGKR